MFLGALKSKQNWLPRKVSKSEEISRFVFDTTHVYADGNPKPTAFKPNRSLETSVYRTSGFSPSEIWGVCARYVDDIRPDKKSALGRAVVPVEAIAGASPLYIKALFLPHPRHAEILGWKDGWESGNKALAQILADESTYYTRPN